MKGSFILLNKERGITSNKIDNKVKNTLYFSKVGHLGTLDPDASGLLILMTDRATKCAKYFEDLDKVYEMTIIFGQSSDTFDLEGNIIESIDVDLSNKEKEIDEVIASFKGILTQTPPIYSAIKVEGMPLYRYAHKGLDVEIPKRTVKIYDIERISPITYIKPHSYMTIIAHVSKGFYMRSLAFDLGQKLGVPSMSKMIKRIKEGPFSLDDAFSLDDILNNHFKNLDPIAYLDFPRVDVDDLKYKDVLNCKRVTFDLDSKYVSIYHDGEFVEIYQYDEIDKLYKMDFLA